MQQVLSVGRSGDRSIEDQEIGALIQGVVDRPHGVCPTLHAHARFGTLKGQRDLVAPDYQRIILPGLVSIVRRVSDEGIAAPVRLQAVMLQANAFTCCVVGELAALDAAQVAGRILKEKLFVGKCAAIEIGRPVNGGHPQFTAEAAALQACVIVVLGRRRFPENTSRYLHPSDARVLVIARAERID